MSFELIPDSQFFRNILRLNRLGKECPHCCSSIPAKAMRCPHCTSELQAV